MNYFVLTVTHGQEPGLDVQEPTRGYWQMLQDTDNNNYFRPIKGDRICARCGENTFNHFRVKVSLMYVSGLEGNAAAESLPYCPDCIRIIVEEISAETTCRWGVNEFQEKEE